MAKKRRPQTAPQPATAGEVPAVGAREPCPCGSGRRYKACHGRAAAQAVTELVRRPFEGLPGEVEWVALRELVPAATAELTLRGGLPEGVPSVRAATVLPLATPGLRRADGSVLLGLQNDTASGDLSRDLADVLRRALEAEPDTAVPAGRPGGDVRLQDLLDPEVPLSPVVHEGFDFWLDGTESPSDPVAASLERANSAAVPTARLAGVDGAYWCKANDRNHLRWVMTHPEERLLDALARLHAAGASALDGVEGSRLVGSFRAHGLLVPVWDLPEDAGYEECEKPAAAFAERLAEALGAEGALSTAERKARDGLANRQVTLS
ncbi:DUF5926 family protein [Streptomyces sulphureus]|uniref:DUF5926 family protein n=1 Tax=Streptomyces sulphureus TaxID=47758 RepID=UPI00035C4823|nr:DUF5926 family protein [Streptomyces sulphureus]